MRLTIYVDLSEAEPTAPPQITMSAQLEKKNAYASTAFNKAELSPTQLNALEEMAIAFTDTFVEAVEGFRVRRHQLIEQLRSDAIRRLTAAENALHAQ